MCGIAGCIGRNPPRTADWLQQMQDSLRKRGPDDYGMWQSGNVALAHTRLSIIDVEGSPQPMANHDGSLVVTYNGEIYNYRKLRRELRGRGYEFRTQGDTEVLLHLYRERGPAMLPELDGMFAFALYDARERKLVLARDRAGIKFLFYWHDAASGELAFASDLGTLMRNRAMPRRLNPRALAQYLHFGYVVHPDSWLKDVRQLEPGQALEWQNGELRRTQYYRWRYQPSTRFADAQKAEDELRGRLSAAVESHLEASDVPVGSFLSGGLDSTAVTGLAQKQRTDSGTAIDSFTVRFWQPEFDESLRARAIAGDLGTRHNEIAAEEIRFDRDSLDRVVDGLGEPFGDTSALAVFALCRRVREFVKVALSGDGGDEIFLGYTGLRKQRLARRMRAIPQAALRISAWLAEPAAADFARRIRKCGKLCELDDAGLIIEWARRWEWHELEELLNEDQMRSLFEDRRRLFPEVRAMIGSGENGGFEERQIQFHMGVDLPCDNLFKVDRMSMAHGLEVRVPMLDNGMLEFAGLLPLKLRSRGARSKEPLRTVAESLAPTLITPSPKRGFRFPLDAWMRPQIGVHWRDWELTDALGDLGFCRKALNRLVERYEQIDASETGYLPGALSIQVFDLMMLGVWSRNYGVSIN